MLNRRKLVKYGDILEEDFFLEGEIAELIKGDWIEEYRPHIVTKEDLELTEKVKNHSNGTHSEEPSNRHHIEHYGLEEGHEIHAGLKGFKFAKQPEVPASAVAAGKRRRG